MKWSIRFRYRFRYRSFRAQCTRQLLKMVNVNVNKIQTLKYGECRDPKYTYTRKREITRYSSLLALKQCWNEFIFCSTLEPNKVLRLISVEKNSLEKLSFIQQKFSNYQCCVVRKPNMGKTDIVGYGLNSELSTTR